MTKRRLRSTMKIESVVCSRNADSFACAVGRGSRERSPNPSARPVSSGEELSESFIGRSLLLLGAFVVAARTVLGIHTMVLLPVLEQVANQILVPRARDLVRADVDL